MLMQNTRRATVALVALLVAGSPLAARAQSPAPAASSDAMSSMADVSCDKAASMMTTAMPQGTMPAATDVDQAYSTMMASHAKMMLAITKVEIRCGKDKHVKDNAARMLPDLEKAPGRLSYGTSPYRAWRPPASILFASRTEGTTN